MRVIRIFFKQLIEGFKSVFKQGWMSFSAILTIAVALFLASVLFIVVQNVDSGTKKLEDDLKIVVRMEDNADKTQVMDIVKNIDNVKEVTYKSKDDSLKEFENQYGSSEIFKNYQGSNNPLKDLLLIRVFDKSKIEETAAKIGPSKEQRSESEKTATPLPETFVAGIYDLDTGGSTTKKIVDIFANIRLFGFIVIGFVLVVSFILISNTIRMTIIARRNQIQIMRLVGASNFFIRLPFFFEGIFIGIFGSLIPIAGVIFGYPAFIQEQGARLGTIKLIPANEIIYQTSIYILCVAVFVGAFASLLSITRYLRK